MSDFLPTHRLHRRSIDDKRLPIKANLPLAPLLLNPDAEERARFGGNQMRRDFLAAALVCGGSFLPGVAASSLITITDVSQLDFSGTFEHAYNFNGTGIQQIGDAVFVNKPAAGIPPTSGFNRTAFWNGASNIGTGAENDALEAVMRSLIWSSGLNPGEIDLDVTAGAKYRLQLLFSEGCCNNRSFSVQVEGLPAEEIVGVAVGGSTWVSSATQGYALSWDFTAIDSNLDITLSRRAVAGAVADTNYHISGLTLERIPTPAPLALLTLGVLSIGLQRYKAAR